MTRELQEYYENYFSLFETKGWKEFQKDIEEAADTIDILNLKDAKELHIAQGQLQILNRLLNWKDTMTSTYDTILQEDADEII
tara:strand:+ start:1328 stop:1576 length:249 start_codon:yes stop_codon:yes gene_type:complete